MAITKAKRMLVNKKVKNCLTKGVQVEKHKIVVVVNQAWDASFAQVQYNKNTVAA